MESEKYYHVYNRSINKELLFKEQKNYQYFLNRYKSNLSDFLDTFCYCLMPTHFHLFVRVKENKESIDVIEAFRSFFISYSKSINKAYGRTGSLFQHKFKKKQIDNDYYYSMIIAYIHLNPVRSGLVKTPKDWMFSSYNAVLSDKPTLVQREEILNWFGEKTAFIDFHESFDDKTSDIFKISDV